MLEAKGLVKIYGTRRVVDGVNFRVQSGEIVGLLGPNGAGKTTSFRMTCGMIVPNDGKVKLNGVNVTDWPMYRRAREGGMGYLAQNPVSSANSPSKKICFASWNCWASTGKSETIAARSCSNSSTSSSCESRWPSRFPAASDGGWKSRALVSNPKIILLDEPFTGIDPVTIDSIQKIIRQLRRDGIAILITDHQVRETLQITDRVYLIRGGKVDCHGRPDEVLANPEARKYYFGEDMEIKPKASDGVRLS